MKLILNYFENASYKLNIILCQEPRKNNFWKNDFLGMCACVFVSVYISCVCVCVWCVCGVHYKRSY